MSFLRQGRTSNILSIRTCKRIDHVIRTFKALQTSYGHAKRFKRRPCKQIETNYKKYEKFTKGHNISATSVYNSL